MFGLRDLAQAASATPSHPVAAAPPASTSTNPLEDVLALVGQTVGDVGRTAVEAVRADGVGALQDTAGMVDRIDARQRLAGRFHVVGDKDRHSGIPNDITAAEFARVAHIYSDVRMGRGDLTLDPGRLQMVDDNRDGTNESFAQLPVDEQASWRDGVLENVANALQTDVGREELGLLNANPRHHHTTIAPNLYNRKGYLETRQATSNPTDPASAQMLANGAANTGSDVTVNFNPNYNIYAGDEQEPRNAWMRSMRSDVTMMHELTHALYETLGLEDHTTVNAHDAAPGHHATRGVRRDAHYVGPEGHLARAEHQAVGLGRYAGSGWGENQYRRQRRVMGDHAVVGQDLGIDAGDRDAAMTQRESYVGRGYHPWHPRRSR